VVDDYVDPDADAQHRFVASATPGGLRALARCAGAYPELAELVGAIRYAQAHWPARIAVLRVSARWAELRADMREHGWRILRIPGAVQDPSRADGKTGPVYLLHPPTLIVDLEA
jgi:hypothetical protein